MASKISKAEIEKDLGKYKAIEAIANHQGGKELVKLLLQDIVISIDTIAGNYKELAHTEFVAQACRLSERLAMYRILTGAKKNVDIVSAALKESDEDPD